MILTGLFTKLKGLASKLTIPEILLIVAGCVVLSFLLSYGGSRFEAWKSNRAFEKERTQRLKETQVALAAADAANKKAEAKEQQAAQIETTIGQKAAVATAKADQLEKNDAQNMAAIDKEFADKKAAIESDGATDCERIADSCATAAKLGLKLSICEQPCVPN